MTHLRPLTLYRDVKRLFPGLDEVRLGLVITNHSTPRQYEENLLGVPFHWL